jgi:hypothetical protein
MANMPGTQCQPSRDERSLESEIQALDIWPVTATLLFFFGFIGLGVSISVGLRQR